MSTATEKAKKAAIENQKDHEVIAIPGAYNLNLALHALAEAIEGIERRLERLEKRR
jgi:6,7-dimethyl-8-ribityllumazine synthase